MSKNGSTPTLPDETMRPDATVPNDTPEEIALKIFKNKIDMRITNLKLELNAGNKMLLDLGNKTSELQATLLRISGAIQVLEELMNEKEEG